MRNDRIIGCAVLDECAMIGTSILIKIEKKSRKYDNLSLIRMLCLSKMHVTSLQATICTISLLIPFCLTFDVHYLHYFMLYCLFMF